MVMHTLNCTYGGGINHEAESCCCFLGRVAEQIRRCRWSSWAAARLNCQDCCQNSLSSKVHLLGIFSLPWCQRCRQWYLWKVFCSANRILFHSLTAEHVSFMPQGLGLMQGLCSGLLSSTCYKADTDFPGGLCNLLTPFGHRAGRKSKDALEDMSKEAGMKACGRTGDRSCPGSVLVHVSRGSAVLMQR